MTFSVRKEAGAKIAGLSELGAIGFALAGFTFWVFTDTTVKLVGRVGLPAYEVVAFLGLSMAMVMVAYSLARGQMGRLRPHRLDRQLARASLDMLNNVCVVIALQHLTLTLFYILIFTAPMVITLLSAVFLREGLSVRKGIAIVVGFAGVLIAVNPLGIGQSGKAADGDWIGFAACMVCVTCFSVNMVWSRVLTRTETPESLAFFSGVVTAAAGFALMLWRAAPIAEILVWPVLPELFATGLFCGLGTLCFYIAVKHTSAANVSQYHYTQLVTGTLVTYLVWHTKPGVFVLAGAALILGSGLYIAVGAREVAALKEGS
jgi:drug/metabolite transporter (DMT)-like permease